MDNNQDIRALRQQLGWSAAEMARRLGIQTEVYLGVESGEKPFDCELRHQLQALANYVESNAFKVASLPLAEAMMKDLGVDQILRNAILK